MDYEKFHVENYGLIANKHSIPINIIEKADIFIYQPIDKKHGIYSTDITVDGNIMSYLPSNCKVISFPYIYNSSLWPLIPPCKVDGLIGDYSEIDKYINKEVIEELKYKGFSLNQVLHMYKSGKIDFQYDKRFKQSIEILKKKESLCDVKVSDFIINNISKYRLFLTQNHPTTCVFIHCVNQILSILGSSDKYDLFAYSENECSLSGEWPNSSYDSRFWKFHYIVDVQDNFYIDHITYIYNAFSVKRKNKIKMYLI
jgi:hypothetical protein